MLELGIGLHTLDSNALSFFEPESNIQYCSADLLELKSYSLFVTNNPLLHIKNNVATSMHLNTVVFCHDTSLLSMKKEDLFLVCKNIFRPNDQICYLNDNMKHLSCNRTDKTKIRYCVPKELEITETPSSRTSIGMISFNKQLDPDYLNNLIGIKATNLVKIPSNIADAKKLFNNYKTAVELDPSSIMNVLWAIACGCIGIIMDPNNTLASYRNIPNLYIANSIDELKALLTKNIMFNNEPIHNDNIQNNYSDFQTEIMSILKDCERKAFIL